MFEYRERKREKKCVKFIDILTVNLTTTFLRMSSRIFSFPCFENFIDKTNQIGELNFICLNSSFPEYSPSSEESSQITLMSSSLTLPAGTQHQQNGLSSLIFHNSSNLSGTIDSFNTNHRNIPTGETILWKINFISFVLSCWKCSNK